MATVIESLDSGSPTDEFSSNDLKRIEARTREIGETIYAGLGRDRPWLFQRKYWDDRIMNWSMSDERLKVQLFRFVDVLPMLHTDQLVAQRLGEYLHEAGEALGRSSRTSLKIAESTGVTRWMLAKAARIGASDFAKKFIAGTNTDEVIRAAKKERDQNRAFTLDILGEAVTSDLEATRYFEEYIHLLEQISPTVNRWPENPLLDADSQGPIPRVNLSVKLSSLDCHFDPVDRVGVTRRVAERLRTLLRVARKHQAFINIDMESYDKKDLTLHIYKSVLMEDEFRNCTDVGIVIQCYLRDSGRDFVELRDWVKQRGTPVWVRLVKGAYWDYETIHAQAEGWPIPVYQQKWQSDANFERQVRFVMRNVDCIRPAIGSHNLRSISHAIAVAEHLGLSKNTFEMQMLYGMADAEKRALTRDGYRVRVYMPYGELIPGMAYLVRRLLENTSNDSFLRAGIESGVHIDRLMADPASNSSAPGQTHSNGSAPAEVTPPTNSNGKSTMNSAADLSKPEPGAFDATFQNEPPIDFAIDANREKMKHSLIEIKSRLGKKFPLVINGEAEETDQWLESINPSDKQQVVGRVAVAGVDQVDRAVAAARAAQPAWAALGAEKRAEYLRQAAQRMREHFFELSAWEVFECGKPWREATNDICEAIDFLEFYAQGAIELEQPQGADVPGEENRFGHLPRGVCGVIAPWNFPIAILTGMTAASIATGNTAVIKPAEQASVTGALFMEVLQAAELPPGVVNFVPGYGETAGARIVEHPDVALIAFTGSRPVGLGIYATAARVSAEGIPMVKHVIAEMGGKNAIIVDADADLDDAVLGTIYSAFGFQGQKCSACSRVIVLESVYDAFVDRLVESARSLIVAPAEDPSCNVGPVIDEAARDKVRQYIDIGKQEGRMVVQVDAGELQEQGYFVGPHVFADITATDRLAQEEIFGPVLAIIRVKNLDEAIEVANGTEFALTGGMFSRSPANLDRVRRELRVGNIYLNRTITGALVGRHPFGGFKMSGIGNKAGCKEYLLQFVLPQTVTENTMRRGFAPVD